MKDIIVIIIAGTLAGVFAPKITPPIVRWLEKKGLIKNGKNNNQRLNRKN